MLVSNMTYEIILSAILEKYAMQATGRLNLERCLKIASTMKNNSSQHLCCIPHSISMYLVQSIPRSIKIASTSINYTGSALSPIGPWIYLLF